MIARLSLRSDEDALDTVQTAMMQLVQKYAHKPPEEWRPLFYRILDSRIRDWHRRRMVRDRVIGWLGPKRGEEGDRDAPDPVQLAPDIPGNNPAESFERGRTMEAVAAAVARLPQRQRQAFLLRCWEGLSTGETAYAMKCSEGSVKTHYHRALQALRELLEEMRE
jgi:RNA polymerase sigma-70 factor (ECF subfamily)